MYNVQFQILKRYIMNYRIRMIPDCHIYRLNIVFSFEKCAGAVQFQSETLQHLHVFLEKAFRFRFDSRYGAESGDKYFM